VQAQQAAEATQVAPQHIHDEANRRDGHDVQL